ncbi:MAG: Fe-S cluster assembly protein HesB [Intrasporangium sp.]|uniref:HhH-GPD-type base excision DNA repair protein n=1 Tax=Intrasporangium sp. TaxID=1925024 RepID=UPI002648F337|nr:HhH-GPD-type base excision DNA repair protein [Intrasporangium sp.]MDN5797143.1 Fe-S cluster assembly protein HesB [Intrasporangium sp.]
MSLHLATTDAGNALLERDPLALMIGMMLDQQVPMEKAFTSPSVLAERLGVERLDAAAITSMPPDELVELFKTPPALHRFPGSMAARAQQLCQAVVADWDGDAANVWAGAESGAELVRRLGTLPGFGAQKARIFAALLAKRLGVRPDGWQEATGDYGLDGYRSIADIIDEASKGKVREYKKAMKARAKAATDAGT